MAQAFRLTTDMYDPQIILTTASVAYFSMASNLGYVGIPTEFAGVGYAQGVYRQIWVRLAIRKASLS